MDRNTETRRLSVLEQEMSSVQTDVSYIKGQLADISTAIKGLSESSKTNWGTLAAWATVIIAVMAYHSNLVLAPLIKQTNVNMATINRIDSSLISHMTSDMHPGAKIRFENLKDSYLETRQKIESTISKLDDSLQREMRLLDSSQIERLDNLDNTLQREMAILDSIQDKDIDHLRELLAGLEKRFEEHAKQANHPLGVVLQIEELRGEIKFLKSELQFLREKISLRG